MLISISEGVFIILCAALLVQLFYYLYYFSRISTSSHASDAELPPVSVIICAKNEAENLQNYLPRIFGQDYPVFEVVVVNDCSYDGTGELLEEMERKYDNLHIVTLKEDEIKAHDKKLALTLGIKGAKYPHLLLTDADCVPLSTRWIRSMMRNFTGKMEIVIGYSPYQKTGGLLNALIRFDTANNAMQYLGCALAGSPYMGVGRNLAYVKDVFFRNKGFASHYHIQSGDDDLFINKVSSGVNTAVEISHDSLVYSNPKNTYKGWINQKRRHITTSAHYKSFDKFRLGLYNFSVYLFFTCVAALFLGSLPWYVPAGVFALRWLVQLIIYNKAFKAMKEGDLLIFSFILEIILLVLYPVIAFSNMFVRKHRWK